MMTGSAAAVALLLAQLFGGGHPLLWAASLPVRPQAGMIVWLLARGASPQAGVSVSRQAPPAVAPPAKPVAPRPPATHP